MAFDLVFDLKSLSLWLANFKKMLIEEQNS